ncbi:EAL domain-containing protein [Shewanella gaetbuli]
MAFMWHQLENNNNLMPKLTSILFILICWSITSVSFAASFSTFNEEQLDIVLNYEAYTVENGLSQNTVTSVVEDSEGYVWIGTVNGLNRFDGTDFTHFYAYDNNRGLPSSFIRNLMLDSKGQLIVGTDKGLVIYDKYTETFTPALQNHPISTDIIWAIYHDSGLNYVGLKNEVFVFDASFQNIIEHINDDRIKEVKKIRVNQAGIYIRNFDGDLFLKDQKLNKAYVETTDFEISNSDIYYTKQDGLYLNDEKISSDKILGLSKSNNILLGLSKTELLSIKDLGKIRSLGTLPFTIKSTNGMIMMQSTDENIYISSYSNGVNSISTNSNLAKKINNDISNIWSISKNNGYIFIATNEPEVSSIDIKTNKVSNIKFQTSPGYKSVLATESHLYIATSNGLEEVELDTGKSRMIFNEHLVKIKLMQDNRIAVGTYSGSIIFYDIKNNTKSIIDTDTNHPIFDFLQVEDALYIASQKGLFKFVDDKVEHIYDHELVTSILSFDGKIFFSARASIMSYDLKNKSLEEIFNNGQVLYSLDLIDKTIVAPSSNNIYLIDSLHNNFFSLSQKHGALADYTTQSTAIYSKGIYIGGPYGLSYLNPSTIMSSFKDTERPIITFTNLSIFNKKIEIGTEKLSKSLKYKNDLILSHSEYPFTIKFGVIGKSTNEFSAFYKLKGIDAKWLPSYTNNSATYTSVPHGRYTFSAYVIDNNTGMKSETETLDIIISPPWWLSNQAKMVYGIIIFIICALIVKAVLRKRQIQKQIALSEERLKLSLWGSGDEMWDWDIETGKIFRSNIWGTLDFPQDGHRSGKLGEESNIHPIDQPRVQKALNDHFSGVTDHFEIAYRVKGRNDQWMWILDRAKIVERDQKDVPVRMTGTIKDINNIKVVEERLKLFARAIENISEGMFILDQNYQFVEVNEACCDIALCTREQFLQQKLEFDRYPKSYSEQIRTTLCQHGRWNGEIEANKGDNSYFLMELNIDAIYNEQGETSHYVGVFSDITRRKQQEEELRKLTNNDLLTGLPNRSSLQVTLNNLVKKDIHHTLMVLDLDNFKRINDSLGHQVGDELLISVADRINTSMPDHASLYRLGGDEFAILIDQNPDIGSSAIIASNIIQALKPPFNVNNENLVLGISVGIVLYPEDEQNEQALLRKADIAMYHAKSAGGNRYQFFSESLNQNAIRQLEIENLIREALKDDLFEVYYQPKIDVKHDQLAGMEALVRLNHPKFGLIPPNDFIPLAEENGLIVDIGDVVLKKACFAAKKWLDQGVFSGRVAVNLSSRQFALADLQQRIESILRLTQLPAHHLELEITEGTVIKNPENAIKVMQQLAKMGISLALDDFGTGYSSLSYLKRFPINCLKIDKSFVDDIDKSDRDLKMVDSIITIAHNMGLSVVGEGVEETAQLNILKALKCEEIQGYIYSKPVPELDFEALLALDSDKRNKQKANK